MSHTRDASPCRVAQAIVFGSGTVRSYGLGETRPYQRRRLMGLVRGSAYGAARALPHRRESGGDQGTGPWSPGWVGACFTAPHFNAVAPGKDPLENVGSASPLGLPPFPAATPHAQRQKLRTR